MNQTTNTTDAAGAKQPEFPPLSIWGELGEKSLAVGPVAGGVAVAELVTTDGAGRFTEETAQRGARFALLFAAAPRLLHALDMIQANPSDPRTHREAFDAMKEARGNSTGAPSYLEELEALAEKRANALEIAQATIERLAQRESARASVQGTLDVIAAALAGREAA